MACINMYNPDGAGHAAAFCGVAPPPPMSPRISFSSDFAVEPPAAAAAAAQNRAMALRCQEDGPDFEFSVGSHPMMAADQLFSKGRILPLKDSFARLTPTLRDELRGGSHDNDQAVGKGPASRWKEMLGLRKALCTGGAKKSNKAGAEADMLSTQEL